MERDNRKQRVNSAISVAERPKRLVIIPKWPVVQMETIPGFEFHFNDEVPSTASSPGE